MRISSRAPAVALPQEVCTSPQKCWKLTFVKMFASFRGTWGLTSTGCTSPTCQKKRRNTRNIKKLEKISESDVQTLFGASLGSSASSKRGASRSRDGSALTSMGTMTFAK